MQSLSQRFRRVFEIMNYHIEFEFVTFDLLPQAKIFFLHFIYPGN
jgi:hypothetical protein